MIASSTRASRWGSCIWSRMPWTPRESSNFNIYKAITATCASSQTSKYLWSTALLRAKWLLDQLKDTSDMHENRSHREPGEDPGPGHHQLWWQCHVTAVLQSGRSTCLEVEHWMNDLANGCQCTLQPAGLSACVQQKNVQFLNAPVPHIWPLQTWPPSNPDLNPYNYYM